MGFEYYIDINKNKYNTIADYDTGVNSTKVSAKELLVMNPKLMILSNSNQKLYFLDNTQMLYLYPLNILDYIDSAKGKKTLKYYLYDYCNNIDYIECLNKLDLNNIKNIEIFLSDKYTKSTLESIFNLVRFCQEKEITVTYNIKKLRYTREELVFLATTATYLKIFFDEDFHSVEYDEFIQELVIIKENIDSDCLLHIKTYLNIEQARYYDEISDDFLKVNVDIFQVSKELIKSNDSVNPEVSMDIQKMIRDLESKYSRNFKFVAVKDITKLYYPRFELDWRNTRKCHSCYLKPYILGNVVLPCKVDAVKSRQDIWKLSNLDMKYNKSVLKRCGLDCSDCASIFENDTIEEILNIITDDCKILLVGGDDV